MVACGSRTSTTRAGGLELSRKPAKSKPLLCAKRPGEARSHATATAAPTKYCAGRERDSRPRNSGVNGFFRIRFDRAFLDTLRGGCYQRPAMLAIKKHEKAGAETLLLLWLTFAFCGCAPPGPRALLKGERLIRQGKYEQAIQSLQEATRLLPKNAQAYNHLGLALHVNKQLAPALAAYQKALALDHKLAAAHHNEGCLYL